MTEVRLRLAGRGASGEGAAVGADVGAGRVGGSTDVLMMRRVVGGRGKNEDCGIVEKVVDGGSVEVIDVVKVDGVKVKLLLERPASQAW